MALDSTISGWKSAGTYRVEIDQSVINNDQINVSNLRLVVGFSKQGPINTPILITNSKQFTNLFGQIDRSLETKGSYFHRTVLTCLSAGPVLVLNLLNIDPDTDQVQEKTFSVSTSNVNKDTITLPLLGCYNTDKFSCNTDYLKNQHHAANQTSYDTIQSKNTNAPTYAEILRYQPQTHPAYTKRATYYNPI